MVFNEFDQKVNIRDQRPRYINAPKQTNRADYNQIYLKWGSLREKNRPDQCWAEGWLYWEYEWSVWAVHESHVYWCSRTPPAPEAEEMGYTGMQTYPIKENTIS